MMPEWQSRWFFIHIRKRITGSLFTSWTSSGILSSLFSSPCVPKQPDGHQHKYSQPGMLPHPKKVGHSVILTTNFFKMLDGKKRITR